MTPARILRIYLERQEVERARRGDFNLMNRIRAAFEQHGFRVEFVQNTLEQRLKSAARRGYSLFFMEDPFHDRALNIRRAYFYPYWRIEDTAERWQFAVARARFDPAETDADMARKWADRWRRWLFAGKARAPERTGMVYVPLQGRLLAHRSFQERSPIDMVRTVLEQDQSRNILVGLHPKEAYSDTEIAELETLSARNPRLAIRTGGMEDALRSCDYVVTQNSSAALFGFFFHKPAVLFGKIDFHHIGLNVAELGAEAAFARAPGHRPDFDRYLHWFIQQNAIKADAENAEAQILASVRRHGWQV
ncbi:MAG TPA: hypothetical protein ENJ52_02725 [Aliiroseovarius sp.]|nr:hypothetical protein [Aliiroseovarius sp.]